MMVRSPYEKTISGLLENLGLSGKYNPRHVEAFMRLEHPTLDALSRFQFIREIRIATSCIDNIGEHEAEKLAKSFGLGEKQ